MNGDQTDPNRNVPLRIGSASFLAAPAAAAIIDQLQVGSDAFLASVARRRHVGVPCLYLNADDHRHAKQEAAKAVYGVI